MGRKRRRNCSPKPNFIPPTEEEIQYGKGDPFPYGKHKNYNLTSDELKELNKNRMKDSQNYGFNPVAPGSSFSREKKQYIVINEGPHIKLTPNTRNYEPHKPFVIDFEAEEKKKLKSLRKRKNRNMNQTLPKSMVYPVRKKVKIKE